MIDAPFAALTSAPLLTRADIEQIVETWKERLCLTYWQTTIKWDDPLDDDDAVGECDRYSSYDYATLRFAKGYASWDRLAANRTVVHELLHMTTRDVDLAVESAADAMHKLAYAMLASRYKHELEAAIDRLATILVELGGVV